jgi:hypothetical protein
METLRLPNAKKQKRINAKTERNRPPRWVNFWTPMDADGGTRDRSNRKMLSKMRLAVARKLSSPAGGVGKAEQLHGATD